jgi:glyoxylase I family protein
VRRAELLSDVTRRDRLPRRLRGEAPRVVGVDHVSLTVDDLDRSVGFYCGLLGLTLHDRGRLEPELIEQMTGMPNAAVDYADVDLGSRILELLHHRTAGVSRPIASRQERPGSVHIGLRVDDAAAVHSRLAAAGFAPLSPPRTLPDDGSGWSGSIVFYVRDPDGVMLEIVEREEAASRTASIPVPVPSSLDS